MIEEYITDICYLLNIKEPYVSYDIADFATDTTMAQCDVVNNTIYLYKLDKPNPDYLFSSILLIKSSFHSANEFVVSLLLHQVQYLSIFHWQ